MRPIDVYNSKVVSMGDFWDIESHLSDELVGVSLNYDSIIDSNKIVMKNHFYHNFDGRRYMSLSSVWFRNKPVMIVQNAGREGRDYEARFITDKDLFVKMIEFIRSFNTNDLYGLVELKDENPDLTNFYGHNIEADLK